MLINLLTINNSSFYSIRSAHQIRPIATSLRSYSSKPISKGKAPSVRWSGGISRTYKHLNYVSSEIRARPNPFRPTSGTSRIETEPSSSYELYRPPSTLDSPSKPPSVTPSPPQTSLPSSCRTPSTPNSTTNTPCSSKTPMNSPLSSWIVASRYANGSFLMCLTLNRENMTGSYAHKILPSKSRSSICPKKVVQKGKAMRNYSKELKISKRYR